MDVCFYGQLVEAYKQDMHSAVDASSVVHRGSPPIGVSMRKRRCKKYTSTRAYKPWQKLTIFKILVKICIGPNNLKLTAKMNLLLNI